MFKRLATGLVAAVMTLSAFSFTSYAADEGYSLELKSGVTNSLDSTSGAQYFLVTVPQLKSTEYTSTFQINMQFTNVDTSYFQVNKRVDTNRNVKNGIYYWGENDDGDEVKKYLTTNTFNQAVMTSDGLGMLLISDSKRGWKTEDGTLFEVAVKPADASKDIEVKFVNTATGSTKFTTCKSDATGITDTNADISKEYVIKAGTSIVTEKSTAPAGKKVTVAATTNGTVTASPNAEVAADTEVTLTVTPDEGYELDTISAATATGTVEIVDNKFTMPAEDVTVTATFKKSTYTITLNSTAVGGSVAVDKTSAQMGDEVKVTATAADGYTFDSLTVEGVEGTVEGNVFTFTMPAKNVDLTATATFTKNVVPGTIEATDVKDGVDGFSKGFAAEFKNIPEAAKTTVKWTLTKNGVSQDNSYEYDTTGVSGNVKFGLVITVDAADKFDGVSAAAELE